MDHLAPKGGVYQAGTLKWKSFSNESRIKTLQLIKMTLNFFSTLEKTTETLDFEIGKILNEKGIAHRINRKGSMMSVFFHISSVSNFDEAQEANHSLFNNFFHQMLQNGVYLPFRQVVMKLTSSVMRSRIKEIDMTLEAVRKFEYSNK